MRFGLFGGAQAPRTIDGDPGRGFREFLETSAEAERLGFYSRVRHRYAWERRFAAQVMPAFIA